MAQALARNPLQHQAHAAGLLHALHLHHAHARGGAQEAQHLEASLPAAASALLAALLRHCRLLAPLAALVWGLRVAAPAVVVGAAGVRPACLALLACAFFCEGALWLWALLAAEAPRSGASFAAQLRQVALEDAWLGRGVGLPAEARVGGAGAAAARAPTAGSGSSSSSSSSSSSGSGGGGAGQAPWLQSYRTSGASSLVTAAHDCCFSNAPRS